KYRPRRCTLPGFPGGRPLLLDSSDFLGHVALLPLRLSSADFDLLRPIRFQPLQFDFQDAVVEARLDFVGIDTERQLDRARETAVGALAALPTHVLLLRLRFALARERKHILLKGEIYIIAGNTWQFGREDDAVFAEPDVDRGKIPCGRRVEPGKDPVHLVLHSPQLGKWIETQSRKF